MLLDKTTEQIVRQVLSRYFRRAVADSLEWWKAAGPEDASYLLAELNQEFGTKLFRGRLTQADMDEVGTVGKLIAYIDRKIRSSQATPR